MDRPEELFEPYGAAVVSEIHRQIRRCGTLGPLLRQLGLPMPRSLKEQVGIVLAYLDEHGPIHFLNQVNATDPANTALRRLRKVSAPEEQGRGTVPPGAATPTRVPPRPDPAPGGGNVVPGVPGASGASPAPAAPGPPALPAGPPAAAPPPAEGTSPGDAGGSRCRRIRDRTGGRARTGAMDPATGVRPWRRCTSTGATADGTGARNFAAGRTGRRSSGRNPGAEGLFRRRDKGVADWNGACICIGVRLHVDARYFIA